MLKKYRNSVVWTLFAVMTFWTSMVCAQPPANRGGMAAAVKPTPDLDYITPDAFAAAILYPRSVLKSPQLEYLPVEVLSTVMMKESGLDPMEIEQAIFVAEPPKGVPPQGPPPAFAVILKMASPVTGDVLPQLRSIRPKVRLTARLIARPKARRTPAFTGPMSGR